MKESCPLRLLGTSLCLSLACAAWLPASEAAGQEAAGEASAAAAASTEVPRTAGSNDRIARVQGQTTRYGTALKEAKKSELPLQTTATHIVVEGDTLWDLSARYLQDPMMWPALWSYNPQVTNPHWIYPGDTLYLQARLLEQSHALGQGTAQTNQANQATQGFHQRSTIGAGRIQVAGLYLNELPEHHGHILFSSEEKHLLTLNDEVQIDWFKIGDREKVRVGQRYTIFSQSAAVRDRNGDPLAEKLLRLGTLEIIDAPKLGLATGRILSASREIERGDLILPEERLSFAIKRVGNTQNLEGQIIDSIEPNHQVAEQELVIINRGQRDGVQAGNRWIVFEQREGLERLSGEQSASIFSKEDGVDWRDQPQGRKDSIGWVFGTAPKAPEYPERHPNLSAYDDRDYSLQDLPLRKIGEILVIDSQEDFCTGIVSDAIRELSISTKVLMIQGY